MSKQKVFYCGVSTFFVGNCALDSEIVAVSFQIRDNNNNVLAERCFSSTVSIEQLNEKWRALHEKTPGFFDRLNENSKVSPLVWQDVVKFLNDFQDNYGPIAGAEDEKGAEFFFVSVTPEKDFTAINLALQKSGINCPLQHLKQGCVYVLNPKERFLVLLKVEQDCVTSYVSIKQKLLYPSDRVKHVLDLNWAISRIVELRTAPPKKRQIDEMN